MEKIQMPCTEEQFERDLKPFLVDARVDLSECKFEEKRYNFLQLNYSDKNIIGFFIEESTHKTIPYNPKEFLKHLGIEIYDVGDVVKIGKYECVLEIIHKEYFLRNICIPDNLIIYNQLSLKSTDLKYSIFPQTGVFPYHATLYDLNKTIHFLKSHEKPQKEMQDKNSIGVKEEKPFTLEQAKEMLAIESLNELAYQYYPELKSPVNYISREVLEQLSYGMFGKNLAIQRAEDSAEDIGRPDLIGKSLLVDMAFQPILHKTAKGGTIIEFIEKAKNA